MLAIELNAAYEAPAAHICAAVDPAGNRATWVKYNRSAGTATYTDGGAEGVVFSRPVPRLVVHLTTHETGTAIRLGCR